jgi:hypothetical protein
LTSLNFCTVPYLNNDATVWHFLMLFRRFSLELT